MLDKLKRVFSRFGLYPTTRREIVPVLFEWAGVLALGYWNAEVVQAISRPLGHWAVYLRIPGAMSFWLLCMVVYRTLMDEG